MTKPTTQRRRVSTANERALTTAYLARLINEQIPRRTRASSQAVSGVERYNRSLEIISREGSVSGYPMFGVPRGTKFMGRRNVDRHNGHALFMGLEIEGAPLRTTVNQLSTYLQSINDTPSSERIFGLKTDGSLAHGYNCELYTARATLSCLRNHVEQIMANMADKMHTNPTIDLSALGGDTSGAQECDLRQYGMHCHVGWQTMGLTLQNPDYQRAPIELLRTGYVLTALFRHINTLARKIGGRPRTRWCQGTKSTSIRSLVEASHQRGAINTFTGHGTVEFRFGRGKYDYQHTVGYVELAHAMFNFASRLVADNLDHLAVCGCNNITQISGFYSTQVRDWYNSADLMVWSREREKMQRKAINIMFYDFVVEHKNRYEVLSGLVDAYYQGAGRHFIRAIPEALVEPEVTVELVEEAC